MWGSAGGGEERSMGGVLGCGEVKGDVRSVEENKGRCEGRCGESRKV